MPQKRDYYEVLGVDKTADDNQIKKAYWKLAKQYHPDVNPGDQAAEEKFKEANEAYEVLSNAEKRKAYDQFGHAAVDGSGGAGQAAYNVDLHDLFNSIFGEFGFGGGGGFGGFGGFGGNSFGGGGRRNGPVPGANLRYRMNLDFMEAAFGCEREISIRKEDLCDHCNGNGTADKSKPTTCPTCNGAGQVSRRQQTIFGQMMTTQACPDCHGSGQLIKDPCKHCHGSGRVQKPKKLRVKVPAGINENEMLTLRGEGEPGRNEGGNGDLYIEIHIRPHPVFSREGYNSYCELPITYAQAALGSEIQVPTIDGNETFKLREGTQPGDSFVIKGKGIPQINRPNVRGDHHFRVVLEVPRNLTDDQKELLKKFDDSCTESHYQKRPGFFDKIRNIFSGSEQRHE